MAAGATSPSSGQAGQAGQAGWLFGPTTDIALGCGGLYLVLFSLMAGGVFGITPELHEVMGPFLILAFSIPHYGATLLRVYERSEDRHRYRLFAVWGAVLVYGLYFVGLNVPIVGTWFLTLYLTWSPWHYTGQNFGIALTFLRRAGVDVDPGSRRLLRMSFTLSYLLVALAIHGSYGHEADYVVEGRYFGAFEFMSLGLPAWVTTLGVPSCAIGAALCALGAVVRMRGRVTWRQWLPPLLVLATQSIWFTIPFLVGHFGIETGIPFIDLATRDILFTYIAVSHAAQYLWMTTYFARKSTGWSSYGFYWLKAIAFGQAVVLVPTLLAVKTPLAGMSYDAGVSVLVIAALNLHHFIMDGAIWKLRSGPIANILLRDKKADAPANQAAPPAWRLPVVAGAAGLLVLSAVYTDANRVLGFVLNMRDENPKAAARALDRLDWMGRDSGVDRIRIADVFALRGQDAEAGAQLDRSLELRQHHMTWRKVAEIRARGGDTEGALEAYDQAIAILPRWIEGIKGAGLVAHRAGWHEEAVRRLRPLVSANQADDEALAAYLDSRRALGAGKPEG